MLKLFADNNIKASWYMPSHTILSFPEQMAKVRDSGHEMYASPFHESKTKPANP